MLEATGSEIDDLEARLVWALQKDVLWLQVAVNELLFTEVLECLQNLNGEPPDQTERHSFEVVVLDKLIQVDGEEFEGYDQVTSEHAVVFDADDVVCVFWIIFT